MGSKGGVGGGGGGVIDETPLQITLARRLSLTFVRGFCVAGTP